ncbi:MAG: GntR family transcriptional regulator [Actinobacteria bacterium]|nr:GntR family transcriptional regulator [Actinomycetota bacterium]
MNESKGGSVTYEYNVIDRESGQPIYIQLANIIRKQINAGKYHPGEQLPSEAMLVQSYHVSPMTIRRTINLLAEQNIVSTAQGRGTFVKAVRIGTAAFYLNRFQEIFSDEKATTVKLIEARLVKTDERTARKLKITVGVRAIYIRRLLLVYNQPAFYHCEHLIYDPRRPIVESELEVTILKGLFSGIGSPLIKKGELQMEAILFTKEEAAILKTPLPAAGLFLEHIFFDFDDKPVSWGWFICLSNQLRLHTSIGLDLSKDSIYDNF